MSTSKKRKTEDEPTAEGSKVKKTKIELLNSFNRFSDSKFPLDWLDYELLAEKEEISIDLARTITKLFDDDNTIPFLCRYRRHIIQDTPPEKLRDIQATLHSVRDLQYKVTIFLKGLKKDVKVEKGVEEDVKGIR